MRNVKTDRGFHHPRTGELLCPINFDWQDDKYVAEVACVTVTDYWQSLHHRIRRDLQSGQLVPSGDLWPRFLYRNYEYDPENPWDGLLRSALLVKVGSFMFIRRRTI